MKIVSAGYVCIDIFMDKNEIHPGGESLNFCGNACKYPDTECSLVSVIGNDANGKMILDALKDTTINTDHLRIQDGQTASSKIYHNAWGEKYFKEDSWNGGVMDGYTLNQSELDFIASANAVHTTIDSSCFEQIIRLRESHKFKLAVDFNKYRRFDRWFEFMPYIDVFFISGSADIYDTLWQWSQWFNTVFISTEGSSGGLAFKDGKHYHIDPLRVPEVIDTTGAGDSFLAGFAATYFNEPDLEKAISAATKCAAETIQHVGGF